MIDPWGRAVRYEPVQEMNVSNNALCEGTVSPAGGAAATYAYSAMFMALVEDD